MFAAEKELAKKIVEKYDISTSATLVSAITFDNHAKMEWNFGDITDLKSVNNRIDQLRKLKPGNNILKAVEIARDDAFSVNNGARRGVPKSLIVFIDKKEMRDKKLQDAAKQLKYKGIKVIVIAIGPEVNKKDVAGIASSTKDLIKPHDFFKSKEEVLSQAVAQSRPGKPSIYLRQMTIHTVVINI